MRETCLIGLLLIGFNIFTVHHSTMAADQNDDLKEKSGQVVQTNSLESGQAEALYTDAANFQKGGAYPIAIENWNAFLKKFPKHPLYSSASYYLGICLMQKTDPDYAKAVEAFQATLADANFQMRGETLTNLAWCLYQQGVATPEIDSDLLEKALSYLRQLLDQDPNSNLAGQAFFYSGEISYRLGSNERAIKYFDDFLKSQSPTSALWFEVLYGKGVAQEQIQLHSEATKTYQRILAGCKDELLVNDVRIRLGDLYLLENNFQEAVDQFRLAAISSQLPADRTYALFREAYSLVQLNQFETASKKYRELLEQYPDSKLAGPSRLANAQSLYRAGKMDLAELEFAKICEGKDRIAATESTHWIARIRMSQGRFQDTLRFIEEQLRKGLDGEFAVPVQMDRAESLAAGKKTEDKLAAREQFSLIYQEYPAHSLAPKSLFNASVLSFQLDDYEQALNYSDQFLAAFKSNALGTEILYIKAESQCGLGKEKDASSSFRGLFQIVPNDDPRRTRWLLRACSHWNLIEEPEQTIKMLVANQGQFENPTEQAESRLLLGQAYLGGSEPEKALEVLRQIPLIESDWPKNTEASFTIGQALRDCGKIDEAVKRWESLASEKTNSEYSHQAKYQLANIFQDQGDLKRAMELYQQTIQQTKSTNLKAFARYGYGWSLMQLNDYQKAIQELTPLIEDSVQPVLFDALLARGIAYRKTSAYQLAEEDLEKCLSLGMSIQQKGDARFELALVYQASLNTEQAITTLQEIVDLIPEYSEMENVLHELAWCYKDNMQVELAISTFNRQLEQFPNSKYATAAAYYVGQQMYALEKYGIAIEKFEVAMKNTNDSDLLEKSMYRIAWSLFNQRNYEGAEQAFKRQANDLPNGSLQLDALTMIGECRYQSKSFASALEAYTKARNVVKDKNLSSLTLPDPSDRQICEIIFLHGGQSAAQLDRWQEALQWYDELRERFPATSYLSEVFYESGYANKQLGNRQIALELLKEVAEKYRSETAARARFMMGEILFEDNKISLAIPEFQRVMYGFGANNARESIKNWQAKSGFEAGRCSEIVMTQAQTPAAKEKAKVIAIKFYRYVLEQHPNHALASKAKEKIEVLQVD